eukprot:gene5025-8622_t
MFPIKEDSGYGFKYSIFEDDVKELKKTEFLKNYLSGVKLITMSWGWDIEKSKMIENRDKSQKYNNYDIRLRKIGQSLKLFEQNDYFNSLDKFVKYLDSQNVQFTTATMKRYSFLSVWPFSTK